jgi:hypothetical protein
MRRIVGFVRVGIRTGVGVDAGNGSGVSGAGGKDVEVCTDGCMGGELVLA